MGRELGEDLEDSGFTLSLVYVPIDLAEKASEPYPLNCQMGTILLAWYDCCTEQMEYIMKHCLDLESGDSKCHCAAASCHIGEIRKDIFPQDSEYLNLQLICREPAEEMVNQLISENLK